MLPFLVRHCAWLITHYQVKSDGKSPHESLLGLCTSGTLGKAAQVGRQMERRLVVGKKPGIRRALRWNIGRSAPVSIHLETPREPTMGQKDVD